MDTLETVDATELRAATELLQLTQQVLLQSSPLPTYEINLLQYWAASRPVARIFMATVADRRACRALRATWALHCMAQLGQYDLASCRGCGHYPTYRTCAGCHIAWCGACHTWSQWCWKCYRPRHELHDCGEFLPGRGGPGGNGRFEYDIGTERSFHALLQSMRQRRNCTPLLQSMPCCMRQLSRNISVTDAPLMSCTPLLRPLRLYGGKGSAGACCAT